MRGLRDLSGGCVRELWLRLADTGLLGYRHVLDGSRGPAGAYPQSILANPLGLPSYLDDVRLVSHAYRSSSIADYPSIETWALAKGVSRGQAAPYRRIQFHTIRKQLNKPIQALEGS